MAEASKKPENNLEKGTLVYVKEKGYYYPGIIHEQFESDYKVYYPAIQKVYVRKTQDTKQFFTYPHQKNIKEKELSKEPKYIKSYFELVFWSKIDLADRFPCLEQDPKTRMALRDSKVAGDTPDLTEEQKEIYEAYKYFKVINTPLMKDNMLMLKEFFDNLKKLEKRVAEGWLLEENEDQQRELIEDLETENEELGESNKILSKQIEDKNLMIENLTKEKSTLADQVQKLQEELAKAKKMNIQLTKNLTQNENDHAATKKKLQDSDEKIKNITANNRQLTQQVETLKKELTDSKVQVGQLVEEESVIRKDLKVKEHDLQSLKQDFDVKVLEIVTAIEKNHRLAEKLRNRDRENRDLEKKSKDFEHKYRDYKSKYLTLSEDYKTLNEINESLQSTIATIKNSQAQRLAEADVSRDLTVADTSRDITQTTDTSGVHDD